jgi:hypothetical protein
MLTLIPYNPNLVPMQREGSMQRRDHRLNKKYHKMRSRARDD